MNISVVSVSVKRLFLIGILNMVMVSSVNMVKLSMFSIRYGSCLFSRNLVCVIGVM